MEIANNNGNRDGDGMFKREFTKDQLAGKHHAKLTPELNKAFLLECDRERRAPSDMLRIILEDRYGEKVIVAKTARAKEVGSERISKREREFA